MNPVNNPSLNVHSLLPVLENTRLLDFVKAYYDWLQSSKVTFVNDSGSFVLNEVLTGEQSNSSGIIKQIGEGYVVLKMTTDKGFDLKEKIVGSISSSFATVYEIEDNVLRQNARIVDNRTPEAATGKYFEYLKSEFNIGIPSESTADRRLLAKKIKDLYSTKSNEDAYRFLFRTIFGEDIDLRYPGDEVLRISDGKFEKIAILRARPTADIFTYINQTVRGEFSGAVANIVDIKRVFFGGLDTAEMTLKLVSGNFNANEKIFVVGRETSNTTIYGMFAGVNIVDAGSGYSVGDVLPISGDGFEASAKISSVSKGPINRIIINSVGYGYQVGTEASVINSGTGGSEFSLAVREIKNPYDITVGANTYTVGEVSKVSIINRGKDYQKAPVITLVDTIIQDIGALSENLIVIVDGGDDYAVGDALIFSGGSGANSAGIVASIDDSDVGYDVLLEDGTNILLETQFSLDVLKDESWTGVVGPISRIELTNYGDGYTSTSLPTITVSSVSGANAEFEVLDIIGVSASVSVDVANNDIGIGSIREIEVTNFGIDYTSATIDASGEGDGNAILSPIISGLALTNGTFLNDDGKIGSRIIQDSLFYQDFSYVIRSGLGFNAYRSLVKETLHPAGTEFFGEILILSFIAITPIFYSTIDTDKNNEYVEVIKNVISFFEAGANPPPTAPELHLEIVPETIDVIHGGEHREINVEIALPKAVAIQTLQTENNLDLELFIDVGVEDPYAEIRREIEFQLSQVDTISNVNSREINIEVALSKEIGIQTPKIENQIEFDLFVDVGVDDGYTKITKEIEFQLSQVDTISNVNSREINIEVALSEDVGIQIPKIENQIEFDLFVDVGVDDGYTKITKEIDFQLSQVETIASVQSREINIEISPTKVLTTLDFGREIVMEMSLDIPSLVNLNSERVLHQELKTSTISNFVPSEIGLEMRPNVVSVEFDLGIAEYVAQIQPEVSASSSILTSHEVNIARHSEVGGNFVSSERLLSYSKNIELVGAPLQAQYEIEISTDSQGLVIPLPVSIEKRVGYQTNVGIQLVNPLDVNSITFGELKISALASELISTYQNKTFEDVWSTRVFTTQQKIAGTVTSSGTDIYGTGTSFDTDFSVGDFVVINTEKFIITNIANSSFMEINVIPTGSYTDSAAYRENSL
jgi:hypothetical protein